MKETKRDSGHSRRRFRLFTLVIKFPSLNHSGQSMTVPFTLFSVLSLSLALFLIVLYLLDVPISIEKRERKRERKEGKCSSQQETAVNVRFSVHTLSTC